MKYNNKNNKTVVRAERVAGNFTTIPHRIMNDKRISCDARLLLISTLSDADSFDFSRTGQMNRLGISDHILKKALKELVKYGYLKKSKRHAQYFHYTFSEYGNLNKKEESSDEVDTDHKADSKEQKDSTSYMDTEQFQQDWQQLNKHLTERQLYVNMELLKDAIPNVKCRNDVFELRQTQDKEILKNKRAYYRRVEEFVNGGYAPKENKPKILKEVRRLITDEHKKPSTEEVNKIRHRISHNKYKNKVKKHGFDYETQLVDSYENPLD